jgi:hypothetical protein
VSGNRQEPDQKGTAVPKDTHRTATTDRAQPQLPERVTVAIAELANAAREGLLALAVGTGVQVLQAMLAEDVTRLVGAKGRHIPERTAVRHGTEPGQVTLGGRRMRVRRPRVRTADGTRELPVPSYHAFASTDLLDQLAVEPMLAKLSTRRYQVGLEPVGADVERAAAGTSKLAVSRRFVARTEHALAELLAADLSGLDLVALMVDGIRVAEHCCVVALGITIDGTKIPLALAEGATEHATMDGLAADAVRSATSTMVRPSRSTSMTALQRCSTTVSSPSTLPASSPRPGWAKQRKAGRWCQRSTGTPESISRYQGVKHLPGQHRRLRRPVPEICQKPRHTRPRHTPQPRPRPRCSPRRWCGDAGSRTVL